ncbi:MAG: hypothetical protein K8R56_07985 [Candidatus Eisenbacteria bacterium]|nr:hypothetical protein [Candidatus Eisenbacteria bacterium]
MSRDLLQRLAWPLSGFVVALALGAGVPLPEPVRIALAFGVLVLLPGEAWRRAIGAPTPGGGVLAAGQALVLGVAWAGLAVLVRHLLGAPFTLLAAAGAPWALAPWLIAWRVAPREPAVPYPALPRAAVLAIVLAAVFAGLHGALLGTPVSYFTDSPDHIGTVRRMLASGDAFPRDAFFLDAGAAGADPRKGLWHPIVALVCALSHADPLHVWRALAALIAPLFVLNAAAFTWWLGGPLAAAVGAWALLLTYGGGLGMQYLREAVFATKLADQCALAATAAMLVDLDRRTWRTRVLTAALMLGTLAAHVFGAIQFAVVFGAFAAGVWLHDRAWSPRPQRVILTALLGAAVALPYLVFRAQQAYAPSNIIHTETQGMLELFPGAVVVSFGVLWDWLGPAWLLFPLSWWAWWTSRGKPAAWLLATTTLAVFVLLFVPPIVSVLEPRLGYLLMRFPWMLPSSAAVAFLVVHARDAWRARRRVTAALSVLLLAVTTGPMVLDGVHAFTGAAEVRAADARVSVERWRDALDWMDAQLPARSVVLSDPATSYSVPMLTRHYVTALVDQHSSPNDSLALDRILDARDALDPHAGWARTNAVVKRWGATVIALNGRWESAPGLDYWAPDAEWYEAARARLDGAPMAFHKVWERDRFTVYTIDRAVLDTLRGGAVARPFVRALEPGDREQRLRGPVPALVSARFAPMQAVPGDTISGVFEWHAASLLPAGAYHVAVRFDSPLPAGTPQAPASLSKVWRKLLERLHHQRYRFREDHMPVDGAFGVDRWAPGDVVIDSFRIVVPADVAAGDYTVKVAMTRQPHYPNLRLLDFTSDDDLLDGLPIGTLRVHAGRGN